MPPKFPFMQLMTAVVISGIFIALIFQMQCKHTEKMLEIELTYNQSTEQHAKKSRQF
jgi:uncharacterized protein YacL